MVESFPMKKFALVLCALALVACGSRTPAKNPDPNHTHADFAVWMDGKQMDFSDDEFMSGTSDEVDPNHTKHDKYLHLHDGNGHVIHRHKPGLTLAQFFSTLNVGFSTNCFSSGVLGSDGEVCAETPFRLFVNGKEHFFAELQYVFEDTDHILITNSADQQEVERELQLMTDDACRYSQTCPWKGKPPAENCVSDPEVPCVQ